MFESSLLVLQVKSTDATRNFLPGPVTKPPAINVETEFTVVERQVFFYYIEYYMEIITQTEYYLSITKLGYTSDKVNALAKTKKKQVE